MPFALCPALRLLRKWRILGLDRGAPIANILGKVPWEVTGTSPRSSDDCSLFGIQPKLETAIALADCAAARSTRLKAIPVPVSVLRTHGVVRDATDAPGKRTLGCFGRLGSQFRFLPRKDDDERAICCYSHFWPSGSAPFRHSLTLDVGRSWADHSQFIGPTRRQPRSPAGKSYHRHCLAPGFNCTVLPCPCVLSC